MSRRESTYPESTSASSTSKWSPQQASSRPSKPHPPAFAASSSTGRSAHWPVNSVTGRGIDLSLGGGQKRDGETGCAELGGRSLIAGTRQQFEPEPCAAHALT